MAQATDADGANGSDSIGTPPDRDDYPQLRFGRIAGSADARAMASLARSYFRAAASGDGHRTCLLLYPVIAAAIPETYGRSLGRPGGIAGCACVLAKLLVRMHEKLAARAAPLRVVAVRVAADRGLVRLRVGSEVRALPVRRYRGRWKVDALLDVGLP